MKMSQKQIKLSRLCIKLIELEVLKMNKYIHALQMFSSIKCLNKRFKIIVIQRIFGNSFALKKKKRKSEF